MKMHTYFSRPVHFRIHRCTAVALVALASSSLLCCNRNHSAATSQAAVQRKNIAPAETVEAIEVTIAVSGAAAKSTTSQGGVEYSPGFSTTPMFNTPVLMSHSSENLSQRLQALIKKYDAETVMGALTSGIPMVIKKNGVAFQLTSDWGMPFQFSTGKDVTIPVVKFRKGEIGIVDGEIYVKDQTEALVGEKAFVYTNQQWVPSGSP
jgi:hypothetical protein